MKNRKILVVVSILLVVGLFVAGFSCTTPTSTPTPTTSATTTTTTKPTTTTTTPVTTMTTTTSTPEKVYTMRVAISQAPTHQYYINMFAPYAAEVEQKTQGRIKVQNYPSEQLGKYASFYDLILSGGADASWFWPTSYKPGAFPMWDIIQLPFLIPSYDAEKALIPYLVQKGYFDKEFSSAINYPATTNFFQLFSAKKPIKTLEDLKGMRVKGTGGTMTTALEMIGAIPTTVSVAETYDALQRGIVDAIMTGYSQVQGWKYYEVIKYATVVNATVPAAMALQIRKEFFQSLPKDLQVTLDDVSKKWSDILPVLLKGDELGIEECKKAGVETYTLPAAERERWAQTAKPAWDKWAADMESKGLPGKAALADAISFLAKYK